jgi:hypothetical protein
MNGDVLDLLRRADPAPHGAGYDSAQVHQQVARILQADAVPARAARPRRTGRRLVVPVAACTTMMAVGLGITIAAGWFSPPPALNASGNPAWQQLSQQFGVAADLLHARERVSAPGPEGATMATWTVPVPDRGSCTAIVLIRGSLMVPTDGEQDPALPRYCEQDSAADQQAVRFTELVWHSTATDTDYLMFSGPLGPAATVQLQLDSGARLKATISNGYYLLPAVPTTELGCGALVGRDRQGRQIGLPSFLGGLGCPGIPRQRLGEKIVDGQAGPTTIGPSTGPGRRPEQAP